MPEPGPGPLDPEREVALVGRQMGRPPREPWRVAVRCVFGFPSVIASPSLLADGTPFPTLYWLTCPFLADEAARAESAGATARWAARASADADLGAELHAADAEVRSRRAAESGGVDSCASVGIAGQRDPAGVKCLHAHIACALAGIEDPIGTELLAAFGEACPDVRCARLQEEA